LDAFLSRYLCVEARGCYGIFMTILEWLRMLRSKGALGPQALEAVETTTGEDEAEDEAGVDPFNPFPEPIRIEITDTIDLHTISPKEVRAVLEEYLLEARRAGFRSVRIIHGKGMGVQREMVRGVLSRTPFVREWTDAPPSGGSWGATVAHLSTEDE